MGVVVHSAGKHVSRTRIMSGPQSSIVVNSYMDVGVGEQSNTLDNLIYPIPVSLDHVAQDINAVLLAAAAAVVGTFNEESAIATSFIRRRSQYHGTQRPVVWGTT